MHVFRLLLFFSFRASTFLYWILVYVDQSHLELFRWNILASMNLYFLKNVASLLSVSKLGLLVTLLG